MLATSLADCMASLAISMTTLPMPRGVIYPFAGKSFGNTATCVIQGSAYLIGNTFVFCMSFLLNIFYLFTLTTGGCFFCCCCFNAMTRRRMTGRMQENFKWFIEAPLFIISFLVGFLLPMIYFDSEIINPSPNDTFCSIYSYPQGCNKVDTPSCRGGDIDIRSKFAKAYVPIMAITFMTLIATMFLIVISFHNNERGLRAKTDEKKRKHAQQNVDTSQVPSSSLHAATATGGGAATDIADVSLAEQMPEEQEQDDESIAGTSVDDTMLRTLYRAKETKAIVTRQALMYIGAFFFSHGFTVLSYMDLRYHNYTSYTTWIAIMRLIFQPLQGLFNMLIFMHHKVHSIRRDNPNETFRQALRTVFISPKTIEDPVVSSIEIVMMNDYTNRKNNVGTLRRNFPLSGDEHRSKPGYYDEDSYIYNLSISEMEESVKSELDYVSRVNDASYNGSQLTIHTLMSNLCINSGPSRSDQTVNT
jgi:hypothetical protein